MVCVNAPLASDHYNSCALDDVVATLERAALAALGDKDAARTVDARALQLLLRRYLSGARSDIADAIGTGLANALDSCWSDASPLARAEWVELFVEACALSDDARLLDAIGTLVDGLRGACSQPPLAHQAAAIGACLHAAGLDRFRSCASDTVDELERMIARRYEPGEPFGTAAEQVGTASTLLVAYRLSGRLPYSMLAEELIQPLRHQTAAEFTTACDAARVFCRLAALHADAEYRAGAIVAPGANYLDAASRVLQPHATEALRRGARGAIYAIARLELESSEICNRQPSEIRNRKSEM